MKPELINNTALLVIDMQNGFINEKSPLCIRGAKKTIPACSEIIDRCHQQKVPVFYVIREYREDGTDVERPRYNVWLKGGKPLSYGCEPELSSDMPEEFEVLPEDTLILKPRYSAFFATELDMILRRRGIRRLLLAGTTTPNCIRTTCYDALSLDYDVVVLTDCTSSNTDEIQESNLRDMENAGAKLMSSQEFIW